MAPVSSAALPVRARSAVVPLLAVLVPKCPLCLTAHAAVLGTVGAGAVWAKVATVGGLAAVLVLLGVGARGRRGYGPLMLAVVAAAVLGAELLHAHPAHDHAGHGHGALSMAGTALLVAASLWNAWPRRAACAHAAARD
ncbi:MAG TPA: hypothetical protein VF625_14070 [Longimicrobium sp.]|jgi:hypothetical protein